MFIATYGNYIQRGESAVHKLEHVNDKILKLLFEDSRYVGLANDIDMVRGWI